MNLSLLEGLRAICRLEPSADVPVWTRADGFASITRTTDELSIICDEARVPASVRCERGWRVLKLEGPFPFSAVGVIASLAGPLAAAGIPIFVVSTFDTDYLLVKQESLEAAIDVLAREGHAVRSVTS